MKLYKVEITSLPMEARCYYVDPSSPYANPEEINDYLGTYEASDTWEPEGWAEVCFARWGEHRPFRWPSTKKLYQSRSGAKARADLIESYGATAVVIESDPIVWLTDDVKRRRRREALLAELAELDAKDALAAQEDDD